MTNQRDHSCGSSRFRYVLLILVFATLVMVWNSFAIQDIGLFSLFEWVHGIIFNEKTLRSEGLVMFGIVALIASGILCCVVND